MLLCLCRCSRPLLAAPACSLHCDSGRALIQQRGMLCGTNSLAWKPTYTNPTGHDSVFSLYNIKHAGMHMPLLAWAPVLTRISASSVVWRVTSSRAALPNATLRVCGYLQPSLHYTFSKLDTRPDQAKERKRFDPRLRV